MGSLRFTLGAIQQILQGKTHQAHIAVLPHGQAEDTLQDAAAEDKDPAVSDDKAGNSLMECGHANELLHVQHVFAN